MARGRPRLPIAPGATFGQWTVLGAASGTYSRVAYMCECTCGQISVIPGSCLHLGKSSRCRACASKGRRKKLTPAPVLAPAPRPTEPRASRTMPLAAAPRALRSGDLGHNPKCIRCEAPSSPGTAFCAAHGRRGFVHTAPDVLGPRA